MSETSDVRAKVIESLAEYLASQFHCRCYGPELAEWYEIAGDAISLISPLLADEIDSESGNWFGEYASPSSWDGVTASANFLRSLATGEQQ